jgi:tetratricopeptide (TPR) repeat protein
MSFLNLVGQLDKIPQYKHFIDRLLNTNLDELYLNCLTSILKDSRRPNETQIEYDLEILRTYTHAIDFYEVGMVPDALTDEIGDQIKNILLDNMVVFNESLDQGLAWRIVNDTNKLYCERVQELFPKEWLQQNFNLLHQQAQETSSNLQEALSKIRDIHDTVVATEFLQLDHQTTKDLFGYTVRLVKLNEITSATAKQVQAYYRGDSRLSWPIIKAGGDVERDQLKSILENIVFPSNQTRMLLLTGEGGAGKSTLAWHIAAEIFQRYKFPLLYIANSQSDDIWYRMDYGLRKYNAPLTILVDDVFRNPDAQRALEQLSPVWPILIIATSRSSEVSEHFVPRFRIESIPLMGASNDEKRRVLQQLNIPYQSLDADQKRRFDSTESWLVMMNELITGQALEKTVADELKRLQENDPVVHKAYLYVCFAGQYEVSIPESLLDNLAKRGEFFNISKRQWSRDYIYTHGSYLLPVRDFVQAQIAFTKYYRDPTVVIKEFMNAISSDDRKHRNFLFELTRQFILNQKFTLAELVVQSDKFQSNVLQLLSGTTEFLSWGEIFPQLNYLTESTDLISRARKSHPETPADFIALAQIADQNHIAFIIDTYSPQQPQTWVGLMGLCEQYGAKEQIQAKIESAVGWLDKHEHDVDVRRRFLGFVETHGTELQIQEFLIQTSHWLALYDEDIQVRVRFLRFVETHGTELQIQELLTQTSHWLALNDEDTQVRQTFLGYVATHGTKLQIQELLTQTSHWLALYDEDIQVRVRFLRFVETHGTELQIQELLTQTSHWLALYDEDTQVRQAFLGYVATHGTELQIQELLTQTSHWLALHNEDTNVRGRFLSFVAEHGNTEQKHALLNQTLTWLEKDDNDANVRVRFLGFVTQHGNTKEKRALLNQTLGWLTVHQYDVEVRKRFLGYVSQHGGMEEKQLLLNQTLDWLTVHQNDVKAQRHFRGLLGDLAFSAEQYDIAEYYYRSALKLHKGHVPYRIGLAWSLYYQSQKSEALKELNHALWWAKKIGNYSVSGVYHQLSLYYFQEGRLKKAYKHRHVAINASPELSYNYFELGLMYQSEHNHLKAFEAFEKAWERLPEDISDTQRENLKILIEATKRNL